MPNSQTPVAPERCHVVDFGLPGGTRTPDLLLRRQLLYPVELRAAREQAEGLQMEES